MVTRAESCKLIVPVHEILNVTSLVSKVSNSVDVQLSTNVDNVIMQMPFSFHYMLSTNSLWLQR